jgi:queuine tRNA-ribosyltransferase
MPVGSQGTVKSLTPSDIRDIGFDLVLCNSYHLYLRPGVDIVEAAGGLHRFMGWDGAILTDSGGFQVFSLAALRSLDDRGVTFRSHIDGSEHLLTPEKAVAIQEALGADISMVLDDVPAGASDSRRLAEAVNRTHLWAERCLGAKRRTDQLLFAIVQGGGDIELRRLSARTLTAMDFSGYAVGGLSVGEPKRVMNAVLHDVVPLLPSDRPRYLMGVGAPEDIVEAVSCGVDMFDCVLPTRVARNGGVYTRNGRMSLRNAMFRTMNGPVDPECDCYTCRTFSAAYLHHLFKCEELLAYRLATVHNLRFMCRLMQDIRMAITCGEFDSFRDEFLGRYRVADEVERLNQGAGRVWVARPRADVRVP